MPSPKSILNRIKQLATSQEAATRANERVQQLSELIDLDRYAPSTIARSTLGLPAAQRGFSESLVSTKAPFSAQLMRPSEFLANTPPLDQPRDARIIEQLIPSIRKEKLRDTPLLWIDEYPQELEAGYEGRHRMKSLQELFGDDPVLMNLVQGGKFDFTEASYLPGPTRNYLSESQIPPLELIRRQIRFGDSNINLNPLWMNEP